MITRLAHIGLTVCDLDTMLDFYVNGLGLSVHSKVPRPNGGTMVFLEGTDGEVIEMIQYPDPKPHDGRDRDRTGLHHFGLLVDDIYAEVDRLGTLGVEFDGSIKVNTAGWLAVHFWDPEGNRVHLTQRGTCISRDREPE
jgi:catechol 2,3-dioxygenase-like lactoylglutathione lyase family enzyme